MSWLSKTFGGSSNYSNPADAAMPYLEQVPGMVDKYYNPYIDLGQSQGNAAAGTYAQMAQDPAAFTNALMDTYDTSDWYDYQQKELTDQAAAAAAQGGYTGTDQDIKNQEELTQGLLSKDEQQYLNNLMRSLGIGLEGEQQMYNVGYGASNSAANANIGNLNAEAGLAYKGQENENAYNASQVNGFLSALANAAGMGAYMYDNSDNSSPSASQSAADMAMMAAMLA